MRTVAAALILASGLLTAAPTSAAPVGCGDLGGAVDDGACHVSETTPAYTVDIRFPLDHPDEQAIIDYLSQTRVGFLAVAGSAEARNPPLEMDVTAESFRSARTRSVVLTLFQEIGAAHPTTWYRSFTYDVARNRPVTFETLFEPGADPMPVLFGMVRRDLESRTGLDGAVDAGEGMDPSHYQNFAVTDDSVIFFFGRAELLPSYAGATSVSLPRKDIPPLAI